MSVVTKEMSVLIGRVFGDASREADSLWSVASLARERVNRQTGSAFYIETIVHHAYKQGMVGYDELPAWFTKRYHIGPVHHKPTMTAVTAVIKPEQKLTEQVSLVDVGKSIVSYVHELESNEQGYLGVITTLKEKVADLEFKLERMEADRDRLAGKLQSGNTVVMSSKFATVLANKATKSSLRTSPRPALDFQNQGQ